MSQLQTISTVSKSLGVSSRTLRYYEQIGIIKSSRTEDYAYRVYDEDAIRRLRQIIILRKLRVPVKSILSRLVQELHEKANMRLQLDYLGDSSVFAIVHSVSFPKNTIQSGGSQSELPGYATEEEKSMDDLNKANESLTKLNDSDVRIVYLPPMTVAVSYASGDFEWGPGLEATSKIEQFVKDSELLKIKPDSRGMGFDCSKETRKAYEAWVSIPEDMEVPAPLAKKIFSGGMFVAHVLRDWNFERDWGLLKEWAVSSEKYEIDEERPFFEEMLNYNNLLQSGAQMDDTQIDLLLPIRAITK